MKKALIPIEIVDDSFDFSTVKDNSVLYITSSNWDFVNKFAEENNTTAEKIISTVLDSIIAKKPKNLDKK